MMSFVKISSKGQITLPAKIRKALGVQPKDKLELVLRDKEVIIQPVRSFRDFRGSIIPREGNGRKSMEQAVAEHVLDAD
jgi:AbrB family looped-hinge helix DNA binding protein